MLGYNNRNQNSKQTMKMHCCVKLAWITKSWIKNMARNTKLNNWNWSQWVCTLVCHYLTGLFTMGWAVTLHFPSNQWDLQFNPGCRWQVFIFNYEIIFSLHHGHYCWLGLKNIYGYVPRYNECEYGCVYPHVLLHLATFSHASSVADHHEFS